eukprot:364495-Chlamydomonas_euryale.AAC.14
MPPHPTQAPHLKHSSRHERGSVPDPGAGATIPGRTQRRTEQRALNPRRAAQVSDARGWEKLRAVRQLDRQPTGVDGAVAASQRTARSMHGVHLGTRARRQEHYLRRVSRCRCKGRCSGRRGARRHTCSRRSSGGLRAPPGIRSTGKPPERMWQQRRRQQRHHCLDRRQQWEHRGMRQRALGGCPSADGPAADGTRIHMQLVATCHQQQRARGRVAAAVAAAVRATAAMRHAGCAMRRAGCAMRCAWCAMRQRCRCHDGCMGYACRRVQRRHHHHHFRHAVERPRGAGPWAPPGPLFGSGFGCCAEEDRSAALGPRPLAGD